MRNILAISKRELFRLRTRFGGGKRSIIGLVIAGAFMLAFVTARQMPGIGAGIYRVGISPTAPPVRDSRFTVVVAEPTQGRALLDAKAIDVFVDGTRVLTRNDNKSLYAAGALKRYLEKYELARINAEYDIANAFPLRIEINTLGAPADNPSALPQTLTDLLNASPTSVPSANPSNGNPSAPANSSDEAVRAQIREAEGSPPLPQVSTDPASNKKIIIPSLTPPPNPFAQVILAFLYILPVFFVSVFFTSGFMDEKTNRRLIILLSAPITPFQIILGKMLPYVIFALIGVVVMAVTTQANPLVALAIFAPAVLFIFGIYLMVPMMYRTFKDTTFISMLATSLVTAYLIFPAMFAGISDLAYMSPVTLAVKMYRTESIGLQEYLFATVPLVLIFGLSLYAGTRVLNEEFLMGYRPLTRKIADAVYLLIHRDHINLSILALSLLLIPLVYIAQLVGLAIALNLPLNIAMAGILFVAATIEEISKTAGIAVLAEHGYIRSVRHTLTLSFLSALGFLIGEKGLLLVSLSFVSQSNLAGALFNTGFLPIPLFAHFVFTSIVCVLNTRFHIHYSFALLAGVIVHSLYNLLVIGGAQ